MIQGVACLQIQPLVSYKGTSKNETTLTSFEDVLKAQKEAEAKKAAEAEEVERISADSAKDTENAENTSASQDASQATAFKNPATGEKVVYVDVAAQKSQDTSGTSSSGNTTTLDSMKKTKYDSFFKEAAKKYGVSESLLKGIAMAESNFNANDVSSAGAMGVMQLMPETARELGVTDPYDPEQNIMGGAKCISQKLKEFNGNVELALAAYNAGSGAVRRNGGVPSYCKIYVSRVLSYKKAFETAQAVG